MTNFNTNYDDVDTGSVLHQFAVEFPGAFDKMVPLMRGIREALLAENIGRTQEEVADALAKRTTSRAYLEAMIERGAMRHDLKGDEVEAVSFADQIYSLWCLVLMLDEEREDEVAELRRENFELREMIGRLANEVDRLSD